jgi:hypothetical protein
LRARIALPGASLAAFGVEAKKMTPLANYALTGNILASVIGAVVLCFVILKQTVPAPVDEPDRTIKQVFFTRFGYACAAVCFCIAATLGIVAYTVSRRATGPAPAAVVAPATRGDLAALEGRVSGIEATMRQIDGSLGRIVDRLQELERGSR